MKPITKEEYIKLKNEAAIKEEEHKKKVAKGRRKALEKLCNKRVKQLTKKINKVNTSKEPREFWNYYDTWFEIFHKCNSIRDSEFRELVFEPITNMFPYLTISTYVDRKTDKADKFRVIEARLKEI